jgi:hypothetical protein
VWAASLQQEGAIYRKEVPKHNQEGLKCTQEVPKRTQEMPECIQKVPKCTIFIFATSNIHQLLSVIDEYMCHIDSLKADSNLGEYNLLFRLYLGSLKLHLKILH